MYCYFSIKTTINWDIKPRKNKLIAIHLLIYKECISFSTLNNVNEDIKNINKIRKYIILINFNLTKNVIISIIIINSIFLKNKAIEINGFGNSIYNLKKYFNKICNISKNPISYLYPYISDPDTIKTNENSVKKRK